MTSAVDFLREVHPNPEEFICISCIFPDDRRKEIPINEQKRTVMPVDVSDSGNFIYRRHPLFIPINLWIKRKDLVRKLSLLKALNDKHLGIYYSVSGFGGNLNKFGNPARDRGNVKRIQVLFADFDSPTDASRAFEAGEGFELLPAPNYIVKTSENKLQAIWLAERSITFEAAELSLLYICTKTGGDPAVKDLSRVLRLPGFKNTKLKSGDWSVSAEKRHDVRLAPSLIEKLASAGRKIGEASISRPSALSSAHARVCVVLKPASAGLTFPEIGEVAIKRAFKQWEKIYLKTENKTLADWGLCCYLRAVGASFETMFEMMRKAHDDDGSKGNDDYYRDTARRCLEKTQVQDMEL